LVFLIQQIDHPRSFAHRAKEDAHMSDSPSQSPIGSHGALNGSGAPSDVATPEPGRPSNGFGIASLIVGIFAAVFAFVPFVSYVAIGAGAIAVALGIVGLIAKHRPRGTSIAGLTVGAIGLILAIVMTVLYAAIFFGVSKAVDEEHKAAAATHTVVYSVTGAAQDADVTYTTYSGGSFGTEQASSTPLPFTKTLTVRGSSDSFSFHAFTLSAINGIDDTGSISCSITVDGKTIASQTSSGSLADVTCSGTN
jgi:hypothetical protein